MKDHGPFPGDGNAVVRALDVPYRSRRQRSGKHLTPIQSHCYHRIAGGLLTGA
jgi:hypothetical protein